MKKWIFFLIIIISGILQATLLNNIGIFYVKPDLLLICVVLASLIFDLRWALLFSVSAGLFKDAFSATAFGLNTLLFCVWCVLIIELAKKISIDFDLIKLGLLFVISLLDNIAQGIIIVYSGNFIPFGIFLRNVSFSAVYTTLFLPLVLEITNPIYS